MTSIDTLIRLFNKESHAKMFLSGKIRVGKVSYYKKLESEGRGDPMEGVSSMYSPNDHIVSMGPAGQPYSPNTHYDLDNLKLAFSWPHDLDSYILCLSIVPDYLRNREVSIRVNEVDRLIETFPDPKPKYAVIIRNPNLFSKRLYSCPYPFHLNNEGKVKYRDFVSPARSYINEGVFLKSLKFRDQREYRYQFYSDKMTTKNHDFIHVGDISDKARLLPIIVH